METEVYPVPPEVPNQTYCAFIDVLGYGALVSDSKTEDHIISHRLNSLYSSVATHVGMDIGELNQRHNKVIKAWSFSDSIYLQCDRPEILVVAMDRIFNNTFGYYANFTSEEEWTPMLRCGIAKGWVHEFKSLSAFLNNKDETTPVGPGVAKAYWTSEKSGISGMKIILTEEVVHDLNAVVMGMTPFYHMVKDITPEDVAVQHYFKRVIKCVDDKPIVLYELLWPYQELDGGVFTYLDELVKLRGTFTSEHLRHFRATAELLRDSLDISKQKRDNPNVYERERGRLTEMMNDGLPTADSQKT